MLGQEDTDGIIRPIAFFKKTLNNTQKIYTIQEKELMAVTCGIYTFKNYSYGHHFLINCDNKTITEMSTLESPDNQIM